MDSILTVTVEPTSVDLVDLATARASLGAATDAATASELQRLITATSARFCGLCNRTTFAAATYSETFRCVSTSRIILGQRPIIPPVTSVTAGSTLLVLGTDYEVDAKAGAIYRLVSGYRADWCAQTVVVVYRAGYEMIPPDVSDAILTVLRTRWLVSQSVTGSSQILKSFSIEGVGREDYWTPGSSSSSSSSYGIPPEFMAVEDTIAYYRKWNV